MVLRGRIRGATRRARVVARRLPPRRQARCRLSPDEGRLARRPAHERQAAERKDDLLESRLRRRQGRNAAGAVLNHLSKRPSGGKRIVWSKREGVVMSLSPRAGKTMASAR